MSAEVSASNPRKRVAPSEEAFPVEKSEAGEDRLRRVLDNHERRGYVSAPTPIERMPGLSDAGSSSSAAAASAGAARRRAGARMSGRGDVGATRAAVVVATSASNVIAFVISANR